MFQKKSESNKKHMNVYYTSFFFYNKNNTIINTLKKKVKIYNDIYNMTKTTL